MYGAVNAYPAIEKFGCIIKSDACFLARFHVVAAMGMGNRQGSVVPGLLWVLVIDRINRLVVALLAQ